MSFPPARSPRPGLRRARATLGRGTLRANDTHLGLASPPGRRVLRGADGSLLDLREADLSFDGLCEAFGFSPRERDVANWVRRGLSNKEIASELGTSPQTVKRQLSSVFRKSQVESRTELAYRLGAGTPSR
ncbi:MAG: helix-turn-helix transcriptional regulator [Planctomycetes bacterium]|nr:helix-turn-helix transcriptional regulator [Planctomycetota bacterium]